MYQLSAKNEKQKDVSFRIGNICEYNVEKGGNGFYVYVEFVLDESFYSIAKEELSGIRNETYELLKRDLGEIPFSSFDDFEKKSIFTKEGYLRVSFTDADMDVSYLYMEHNEEPYVFEHVLNGSLFLSENQQSDFTAYIKKQLCNQIQADINAIG